MAQPDDPRLVARVSPEFLAAVAAAAARLGVSQADFVRMAVSAAIREQFPDLITSLESRSEPGKDTIP